MTRKHCHCCHSDYTPAGFARLRYVGVQHVCDAGHGCVELRDCSCGSTIGRELPQCDECAAEKIIADRDGDNHSRALYALYALAGAGLDGAVRR